MWVSLIWSAPLLHRISLNQKGHVKQQNGERHVHQCITRPSNFICGHSIATISRNLSLSSNFSLSFSKRYGSRNLPSRCKWLKKARRIGRTHRSKPMWSRKHLADSQPLSESRLWSSSAWYYLNYCHTMWVWESSGCIFFILHRLTTTIFLSSGQPDAPTQLQPQNDSSIANIWKLSTV